MKIGFRMLRRDRSFAAIAIGVLAIGICAVATQFSVVDAVFLRGFSFPNAERMVSVQLIDPTRTTPFGVFSQAFALDYVEMKQQQTTLERMAAYINGATVNLTIDGRAQRYTGAYVTEDFLRVLGVHPFMGRDFESADNTPGAPKVALVSYEIWQRDLGGNPDVVGKAVRLNGKPATIVGVMAAGFGFPQNEQLWIPLFNEYPPLPRNDQNAAGNGVAILAARKASVTVERASAEFDTFAKRLAATYPETNKAFNSGLVEPLIKTFTPQQLRGLLLTMLGFCVGVLVLACVNVMNMQFARAALRSRELAIRSSLGAVRWRLIRQMLTENSLVAAIGAVLGIAGAYWTTHLLMTVTHSGANPIPSFIVFRINGPVLACVAGAAAFSALISGLVPAYAASRASAATILKDASRGSSSRFLGVVNRALVIFQIVVTSILLIGSALQLESIRKQQKADFGFDTQGVLSARIALMEGSYPDSAKKKVFFDRALLALRASSVYQQAAFTTRFQMIFANAAPIEIEGKQYTDPKDRPNANFENVTPGYFQTLGVKIIGGRDFTEGDSDQVTPVAVVTAGFAEKHFGHDNPVGRRFRVTDANAAVFSPWRTIVGVVSNVRMTGPFNNPLVDGTGYYVPFYASPVGAPVGGPVAPQFATVIVRPRPGQAAASLAQGLQRDVAQLDPDLPLYFVATPGANLDGILAQNRVVAGMFSIFGLIAVILSAVGLYGVMSFSVNQRRQEFGTRMVLGADSRRILQMVLRQGFVQLAIGLSLGLGLALVIAKVAGDGIARALFQVKPNDPLIFFAVSMLITLVAFAATIVPARRATRVDPAVALRAE
ncbi:MAG: ABC transporter permease [Acidobacteriota bacterium]